MARLLDGHEPAALELAAQRLAEGELLAFPTETVYGLGARADDDAAVAKIFAAKGRPSDHPLIVHVRSQQEAETFAAEITPPARRLMAAFWPGPLTVILPRRADMAAAAAGGQDSIGLRCPDHAVARALLDAAARHGVTGVAAPSANRFGRISPTQAVHVLEEFEADDGVWVLDGGACPVGIESSIVDCTRGDPVLLRPGRLTSAEIEAAAGAPLHARDAAAPRASGTLAAHYAPRARLRLMSTEQLRGALQLLADTVEKQKPPTLAVYSRSLRPVPGVVHRTMPQRAAAAAQELFAALRELDASGVQLIWVEEPPASSEWDGVRDRLQRAAAAG